MPNSLKKQSAKKVARPRAGLRPAVIYDKAVDYIATNKKIKDMTKVLESLKAELKKAVDDNRSTTIVAATGTKRLEIGCDSGDVVLQQVCRTSVSAKTNAVQIVKSKFPKHAKHLIETVEIFRLDRLEELVDDGVMTPREAKTLLIESKDYAFKAAYEK